MRRKFQENNSSIKVERTSQTMLDAKPVLKISSSRHLKSIRFGVNFFNIEKKFDFYRGDSPCTVDNMAFWSFFFFFSSSSSRKPRRCVRCSGTRANISLIVSAAARNSLESQEPSFAWHPLFVQNSRRPRRAGRRFGYIRRIPNADNFL